jgi:hypothetical protein
VDPCRSALPRRSVRRRWAPLCAGLLSNLRQQVGRASPPNALCQPAPGRRVYNGNVTVPPSPVRYPSRPGPRLLGRSSHCRLRRACRDPSGLRLWVGRAIRAQCFPPSPLHQAVRQDDPPGNTGSFGQRQMQDVALARTSTATGSGHVLRLVSRRGTYTRLFSPHRRACA